MIPKRRNLISLIFIVNCISKCSLIKKLYIRLFQQVRLMCCASPLIISLNPENT